MELDVRLGGSVSHWQHRTSGYSQAFPVPYQAGHVSGKNKPEAEKQTGEQGVMGAIEQANKLMDLFKRDLRFESHDEAGIIQISVINRNDGKVIRQIPPDMVVDMIVRIKEILGVLMDVKA